MINANDITYSYNSRGYMMYYKEQPIGGAGIDKSSKGSRANIELFHQQAKLTKNRLLQGYGNKYMLEKIEKIKSQCMIN